jgi:LCP family protein required for cell wall assembly
MDFKKRRIRKKPQKSPEEIIESAKKKFGKYRPKVSLHIWTLIGSFVLIIFLLFATYQVIRSLNFSALIFSFGESLDKDADGRTNIMLVGVGGEGHEGNFLTDSIIVASIDYKNKLVPMFSIPRDLYVKNDYTGASRINGVYYFGESGYGKGEGMKILRDQVEEILGLDIQYYAKIDFQGFEDVVDSIGGVDVYVENAIYDPYYPKGETIYFETFSIDEGLQHLDGETALKYARSRKTTSDFDRARRQQDLLFAIKEKALSLEILTDTRKLKEIYDSVADSIETDLSLGEIIELAKLSQDFGKESLYTTVINDDPTICGGLVYTPARYYFDGASVLLPAGNSYEYTNLFTETISNNIKALQKQEKIQILNGTRTPGLAYSTMNILSRYCMNIVYYSNASERDLEVSTIYYKEGPEGEKPEILDLLQQFIPVRTQAGIPPEYLESERRQDSSIVVELGADYIDIRMDDPFDRLQYLIAPETEEDETPAEEQPITEEIQP